LYQQIKLFFENLTDNNFQLSHYYKFTKYKAIVMQIPNPINITANALTEIKNIIHNKNIPADYGLRIGIKGGGGCGSGMSFLLGFDTKKDDDLSYTVDNIPVYIQKKHTMYIIGLEVDFYDGSDARGFVFKNPQAANN
jgi:iron-sulfur cluster assembly protein